LVVGKFGEIKVDAGNIFVPESIDIIYVIEVGNGVNENPIVYGSLRL